MDYSEINAQTIDRWIRDGWEWGVPITHQAYLDAQTPSQEPSLLSTTSSSELPLTESLLTWSSPEG